MMDSDQDQKPWHLTILLLEGLRLMRPEKAWRPIVTLEIDNQTVHETTLGVDGQNINQKDTFKFHDARPSSKLDVQIWHRSQSKKKKKKKILVASASHCLSELVKRCDVEPRLEIRLQCRSPPDKRSALSSSAATSSAAKGRPQKGAVLYMKMLVPEGLSWASRGSSKASSSLNLNSTAKDEVVRGDGGECEPLLSSTSRAMQRRERRGNRKKKVMPWKDDPQSGTDEEQDNDKEEREDANSDDTDSKSMNTDAYVDDISPQGHSHQPQLPQPNGLRRRRRRRVAGYALHSDDDNCMSYSCSSASDNDKDNIPSYSDEEAEEYKPHCDDDGNVIFYRTAPSGEVISFTYDANGEESIISFSDIPLPLYTEKISMEPETQMKRGRIARGFYRAKGVMERVTMYGELSSADDEADFAKVFGRLQAEWSFVGGLLVALAAVDTAVFSISPDSIFIVDSYARSAIATSSVASGLGIACDAWFLLRYNWADIRTFKTRARDVYQSYFFFSLSSRVPAVCMFVSAFSLMLFLGLVAFEVWPMGVLGICFIVGIAMSLQFLVYGVHLLGRGVVGGVRGVGRGVRGVRRGFTISGEKGEA